MNTIVNSKQCTVLLHVDNLKMSHVYSDIFSSVIDDINTEYGKNVKTIPTQGNTHKYLGMIID